MVSDWGDLEITPAGAIEKWNGTRHWWRKSQLGSGLVNIKSNTMGREIQNVLRCLKDKETSKCS